MATDPTEPDDRQEAQRDAPQDPPQDQGPAMDDTQTDATGILADELDPVTSDGSGPDGAED
jgi:hypothetical protein